VALIISRRIRDKLLEKHNVTEKEVTECFFNRDRIALKDSREDHLTDPPTLWLISETNHLRELKLLYIVDKDGNALLKSAYEPNKDEIDIYNKYANYLK